MNTIKILLCFILSHFAIIATAQDFNIESYNKEKQEILNIVINTPQFDSIYSSKKVYFVENELLSKNSPIIIKKKKCKAVILEKEKLERKKKQYVGIGDFTMDKNNPIRARVQIYTSSSNKLLNFGLEKKDGNWIIVNSVIIED